MKKRTRVLAFLLAMVAMLSIFAVSASAKTQSYQLAISYTGTDYSLANPKSAGGNRCVFYVPTHSFEYSPSYIYFSACLDTKGSMITGEVSPTDAFYLTYKQSIDYDTNCYLRMRTEHRAANCAGT